MTLAAVAAMAISAQAVTIKWGSGGQINVVEDPAALLVNSSLAGISAIGLFYLGNTGGTLLTASELTAADAIATSSTVGTKSTTSSTFTVQSFTAYGITAGDIVAGDVFAVFFVYNDDSVSQFFTSAALTTAFNSTYTFTGAETDSTVGIAAYGNVTGAAPVYVPAPVPEPATAALAIAGLAMLIRRRK